MQRMRIQICTAVFLGFTLIKLISPASAVQIKNELQLVLNQNDDYHDIIHRFERVLHPIDYRHLEPYEPHPPLTELRRTLDIAEKDALEIYVEGSSIILKKYRPSCIFCDSSKDVTTFKGKNICPRCLRELQNK